MPSVPRILLAQDVAKREVILRALPEELAEAANRTFAEWAHDGQLAPPADWRTWVLMAGRGFGKTRAGVRSARARDIAAEVRIALVAATVDEARRVMVEGASGILACARSEEIEDW